MLPDANFDFIIEPYNHLSTSQASRGSMLMMPRLVLQSEFNPDETKLLLLTLKIPHHLPVTALAIG